MPTAQDLGCTTSIEVINTHLSLDGKRVIDVGCGNMAFTRPLVEHGACVLAVDPDPVQAKLNREADPVENLEFIEADAENLPAEDGTLDGVFFSFSLHHIPAAVYPRVFKEVIRVLRPDGFLFVVEPTASPLNDVMKLFHNEDKERADAQQALVDLAMPAFETVQVFDYHSFMQYESFEEYATRYSGRSFNSTYTAADVRHSDVEAAFEQHAPDYRFQSPKRTVLLERLK